MAYSTENLLKAIDQSVLRLNTTTEEIIKEALLTKEKKFRALVVHPHNLLTIKKILKETSILSVVVCDFPHGKGLLSCRINEIKELIKLGADEIDIVSNYQFILDKKYSEYKNDLKAVALELNNKPLKIILEVDLLTDQEIKVSTEIITEIVIENNLKNIIIKTKTGYAENKISNLHAVKIIVENLKKINQYGENKILVKASGGIKTKENAIELLDAGAHILGTSAGHKIVVR